MSNKIISRPAAGARMDRRRTEGDHHYQVAIKDLSSGRARQGSISLAIHKERHNFKPMPPLFQLQDTRLLPPSPSEKFSPLAAHPLSPAAANMESPRRTALNRRATLPALLDVNSEALMLSRQLHLDFHEVKCAVQELRRDTIKRKSNGGMDLATFRQMMLRVFAIDDINDFVLQDAYDQCNAAAGPIDSRKFMTWYRDHIFNLQATQKTREDGDDLTLELAKRHQVSCIDMDKVKAKFDHFDVDKSGVIDFQEFEAMMHELLHCHSKTDLPRNRLNRFWHEADLDGNGVIDFEEFTEWYMKYFAHASNNGPVEAFYASFMPDVQRANNLDNLIQPQELLHEGKWDAEVLKSCMAKSYTGSDLHLR